MVVSEKEALYHIQHEEQLYEWKQISKSTLEVHLQNFLDILREYNEDKAEEELKRLNRKYGFNMS